MRRAAAQQSWPENALFPALVGELLAVISAGQHVAACRGCGRLHPRDRKPREDRPIYCGEECRLGARRATKRESMARSRERATSLSGPEA